MGGPGGQNVIDLTGRRFGRLVVLERAGTGASRTATWRCRCDCGGTSVVRGARLRSGYTASCGCLRGARMRKHGRSGSPTYKSWIMMWHRCTDPRMDSFARYGARGISVCARWQSFETFLTDMGERPAGKTLDRINGSGNYEPDNCRWATATEQSRNRCTNRMLTAFGRTQPLVAWVEETGISRETVRCRLRRGMSAEQALTAND